MPSLLTLPRELRDHILAYALHPRQKLFRARPISIPILLEPSPEETPKEDEEERQDTSDSSSSSLSDDPDDPNPHNTYLTIYCPFSALLLTNHQLHTETLSVIRKLPLLNLGTRSEYEVTFDRHANMLSYYWWEPKPNPWLLCEVHGTLFPPKACAHVIQAQRAGHKVNVIRFAGPWGRVVLVAKRWRGASVLGAWARSQGLVSGDDEESEGSGVGGDNGLVEGEP